MAPATMLVRSREVPDVASSIVAIRQEVGAMRAEISARLEQVTSSTSGLERRLLDIEGSFMNHVNARLDSLLDGVTTTHLDIQGLALDMDQAHDRVCNSLDETRDGLYDLVQDSQKVTSSKLDSLSKSFADNNGRTKDAFLKMGHGLDANHDAIVGKLDTMNKDINQTFCNNLERANGNINKGVLNARDHLQRKMDDMQREVQNSRHRLTERLNNVHESLAGILYNMRNRICLKLDRAQSLLGSTFPAMRSSRKGYKGFRARDEIQFRGFSKDPLFDHSLSEKSDISNKRFDSMSWYSKQ